LVLEENLGIDANGDFGFDTLTLGLIGSNAPTVKQQTVAGIAAKSIYTGLWGLAVRPTNLTTLNDPVPSLMSTMKENRLVPSLSFGYTAGAYYRKTPCPPPITDSPPQSSSRFPAA
jgi:hypothetical protein